MAWSTASPNAVHESLGKVGGSWVWMLAYGVLSLLAGLAVLLWPGATLLFIALVLGVQLVIGGVFWFGSALASGEQGLAARIVLAVLGILAGVVVLRYPVQSAFVLPVALGLFWTVSGVVETFHAITHPEVGARGWAVGTGVLAIVAGVALLAFPGLGLILGVLLLGIWLVLYGVLTAGRALVARPRAEAATSTPPMGAAPA
ncbi:HdeD family acid-resistance protein [Saccharopolyspora sp. MS10]|uniref:HdeD family acid-resistance protein n=1 Tax=Saccharopolyspora sp. MS10 TaxID=3385973 RepID=UPI0039A1BC31